MRRELSAKPGPMMAKTTFRAAQAAIVAASLVLAPIPAAQAQPSREEAEQAIKQGVQRILRALEALMHSIPQYGPPEVLDNGDIIIRRKHPEPSPPKRPSPEHDETAT